MDQLVLKVQLHKPGTPFGSSTWVHVDVTDQVLNNPNVRNLRATGHHVTKVTV